LRDTEAEQLNSTFPIILIHSFGYMTNDYFEFGNVFLCDFKPYPMKCSYMRF